MKNKKAGKRLDLKGKKIGIWTVVEPHHTEHRGLYWLCRCECGNEKVVVATDLRRGKYESCARCTPRNTTHAMSNTPEYRSWGHMKDRCNNPNNKRYKDYGGRGIYVCERWEESFEAFYEDMGPRPSENHSIDRIDNSQGYTPENTRWATQTMQTNNSRKNRHITFDGETKTVAQWSREFDIDYEALRYRLDAGWDIKRSLTEEAEPFEYRMITFNGETKNMKQWARDLGIKYTTLRARLLRYGWSVGRAFTEDVTLERGEELVFNGKAKTVAQWAEDLGIDERILRNRLYRGWPVERALTQPVEKRSENSITFNGKTQSIKEWSKETGIGYNTLYSRLNYGWSVERALTEPVRKKHIS